MNPGWTARLRSLLAVLLFATANGGGQLLDAVLFHRGRVEVDAVRLNSGDRCHAEHCDLSVPPVTSLPASGEPGPGLLVPTGSVTGTPRPDRAPRPARVHRECTPRAPPALS